MNDEQFIQEVEHESKRPVSIEREPNDVVVIEGVRYAAELFRVFANPDANLLYALQRHDDQVVVTLIRNPQDALSFFFQQDLKMQLSTGQGASTAPMSTSAPLSANEKE